MSRRYLNNIEDLDYDDEDDLHCLTALALLIVVGAEQSRLLRNARRWQLYLTRPELLPNPCANTPWQAIYGIRSDHAFITMMGNDTSTFNYLLEAGFAVGSDTTTILRTDTSRHGQTQTGGRSLDAAEALGLFLHFLSSTVTDQSLSEIFALIPSTVTQYINFARTLLLYTLRRIPKGVIKFPQNQGPGRNGLDEFSELVTVSQLNLRVFLMLTLHRTVIVCFGGAVGTMDGLNLTVCSASDPTLKNATYNGWLHKHCISSVFTFSPRDSSRYTYW